MRRRGTVSGERKERQQGYGDEWITQSKITQRL